VTVPLTLIRIIHNGCSEYKYWYEYRDIHHELHEIHYVIFFSFAISEVSTALMLIQVSWIVTSSAMVVIPHILKECAAFTFKGQGRQEEFF
jgi:hypothetical protein